MKIITRLLLLAVVAAAVPMFAQTHDWTSAGNNGRVLPAGAFKLAWSGPTLRFSSIQTGTIVANYPVTNTYGSGTSKTPPWTTLWSTYRDNSTSGSVTTVLYEVEKCSGTQTAICTINSSDSASTAQCSSCSFSSSTFDFANNYYYVQVTLARTATSANEEIHSLAIN
jgi:hypothetical protein